jgi:hypothetical protein
MTAAAMSPRPKRIPLKEEPSRENQDWLVVVEKLSDIYCFPLFMTLRHYAWCCEISNNRMVMNRMKVFGGIEKKQQLWVIMEHN